MCVNTTVLLASSNWYECWAHCESWYYQCRHITQAFPSSQMSSTFLCSGLLLWFKTASQPLNYYLQDLTLDCLTFLMGKLTENVSCHLWSRFCVGDKLEFLTKVKWWGAFQIRPQEAQGCSVQSARQNVTVVVWTESVLWLSTDHTPCEHWLSSSNLPWSVWRQATLLQLQMTQLA